MAIQNIRIPSLLGGVTTVSQSQRLPIELEALENCDSQTTRGMDKRPGTSHVVCDGTTESINLVGAGDVMHVFWINRSATERFVGFIYDGATDERNAIQIWDIVTGLEQTIKAEDSGGSEVDLNDADADVAAMIAYLQTGSNTPRQKYRVISVEDTTFLLNRQVTTALEGTAITFTNGGSPTNVRNQNNAQNVLAWSDFDQPPTTTAAYPSRATLVAGGTINSGSYWNAREDDVGLPQGFYAATSGTQPPWYQRLPTEGANGYIQRDTMPLRLDWNGSRFLLRFVDWSPRKAGDSTTNPGPTFIGNPIDDISFHQGRLWFASGERIVSSRAGDIFNLWIDSTALITDADPIDTGVQGRQISNVRLLESFRESLIGVCDGARQVELRANGPITPQSFQIYDSTNVFSANYVEPVVRGSQLLFAGERDFSMIVWEYDYSPQQINNVATDITERVHGYIPAEAHWFAASEAHDQMFVLTLADPDAIYVNKAIFNGADKVLNSWYRWVYPDATSIESCQVFDDDLYIVVERSDTLWYLEKQPLGQPQQDTVSAQTMNYAVRCDRKIEVQGVYDVGRDETDFTLPWDITGQDYHIVAGPTWDTATVKGAGTEIVLKSDAGTPTVAVVEGDWENNADGTDAPVYIGLRYTASAELSELFVRDQQGLALSGNTHLMRMKVRHRDSGGYSVLVTPEGRSQDTITFVPPTVGMTPIDSDQLDDFGEFQVKVLCHARNATIVLSNDTPYPTAWVDVEIDADFIPQSYSPVR
jgi:hypothetical protein